MTCLTWSYSYLFRLPFGISITTSMTSSWVIGPTFQRLRTIDLVRGARRAPSRAPHWARRREHSTAGNESAVENEERNAGRHAEHMPHLVVAKPGRGGSRASEREEDRAHRIQDPAERREGE